MPQLNVRMSATEYATVQSLAESRGMTISRYVRHTLGLVDGSELESRLEALERHVRELLELAGR